MANLSDSLQQQLLEAKNTASSISVHGSGSHSGTLNDFKADCPVQLKQHQGIIDYQPSELFIRVRGGTKLQTLHQELFKNNQQLATDIPVLSEASSIAGAVACGLTGCGRPYRGAIRDHLLGVTLLSVEGEIQHYGGQVMKNVAGYDVSRLMAGAYGTLGIILDLTLRVLPIPQVTQTLAIETDQKAALKMLAETATQALPITAAAWCEQQLLLRLEGTQSSVSQAVKQLGGSIVDTTNTLWSSINNRNHGFFDTDTALWRIILPPASAPLNNLSESEQLIDWRGGQRWIKANEIDSQTRKYIQQLGGFIHPYSKQQNFSPYLGLNRVQLQMQQKIKLAFDRQNRLNPALSPLNCQL